MKFRITQKNVSIAVISILAILLFIILLLREGILVAILEFVFIIPLCYILFLGLDTLFKWMKKFPEK